MLQIFPFPEGESISTDFTVKLNGISADCYRCRVSAMSFNRPWPGYERSLDQTELSSFVSCASDETVDVEVTANKDFSEVKLRPLSENIQVDVSGRTIRFKLPADGQYSLEIDGRHNNLHIFMNPLVDYEKDENTLYFGEGIHEIDKLVLHSGQTLFIDAGAVVYAKTIRAYDSDNISIVGYGILDFSHYARTVNDVFTEEDSGSVTFVRCKNIRIDGVILRDATWWTVTAINCQNICYNNIKAVGMWRYNSDGLDFVNSENVTVRNSFVRSFDDSIVLKGLNKRKNGKYLAWYEYMNVRNYLVENCVVWCDWGGALEIGAETVADEYTNIIFRDCDIIKNSTGAMRLNCGDRAVIHGVLYENINVEYSKYDREQIFQNSDDMLYEPSEKPLSANVISHNLWWGPWTDGEPNYGKIYDIFYKNINVISDSENDQPELHFDGANEDRNISDIVIENYTVNNEKQTFDTAKICTNKFVKNIVVK